jgi:hypothetical protein
MTDGDATGINEVISQAKLKWSIYRATLVDLPSEPASIETLQVEAPPQVGIYPTADHEIQHMHLEEVGRIWLDSISRSCSTDLASIMSLSRRIRRDQLLAPINGQEYAKITPSQVMRRASIASSDFRLFDGIFEIPFTAAESDSMVWQPESINV